MVAGFGPCFTTDITHSSNTLMIVVWSYEMVAGFLSQLKTDLTNASNGIMIVLCKRKYQYIEG